jgi:hypothetical protein
MRKLRTLTALSKLVLPSIMLTTACQQGGDVGGMRGEALGAACGGDGPITCASGQRCTIVCSGVAAAQHCQADPGTGAAFGEACGGGRECRMGVCIGVANAAGTACVPFCASDQDCDAQSACKQLLIQYNCPAGVAPVTVKICRPR